MTIGLIYAMRGEIESLLNTENAEPLQSAAGVEFYQIRPNVIACIGGVSKVNAAMATELLISLYHPDLVLNVGVAGCFEEVPIGTLVLAEAFLQHDVDTTAVGDPAGLVSTVNRTEFPTSDLEKAKAAMDKTGFAYRTGLVATGDWFATDTPRAHWISDTFHPLLCDMEGGADAQVYNPQDEKLVRLVFKDSKTTSIPLIARLAAEEGVFCNVISASTQKLSETVYGSMMLGIPSAQYDKAVAFIHNVANVQVEEVDHHVQ
mgnify:CR=1 FL=1